MVNGTLEKFQTEHKDLYALLTVRFDRIVANRPNITEKLQLKLFTACKTPDDVRALMAYLVLKCRVHMSKVVVAIKGWDTRLALDLSRIKVA